MQNLAVSYDFYTFLSISIERSNWPLFDGVELVGL